MYQEIWLQIVFIMISSFIIGFYVAWGLKESIFNHKKYKYHDVNEVNGEKNER